MRKVLQLVMVCGVLAGLSSGALAQTANQYPNGVEDMFSGMVPPPGFYLIDYNYFYSANKLRAGWGNVDIDLFVYAQVPRFLYVSEMQFMGANLATHLFVPVMHLDGKVKGAPGDFFSQNTTGLGDIIYNPLILAWHGEYWHVALGCDIFMPTGHYNENKFANISANAWTFEPVLALTFNNNCGWSASAKLMYDISTSNDKFVPGPGMPRAKLEYGQAFHSDFAINKDIGCGAQLGLAGYCFFQTTSAKVKDIEFDTYHERVWALGPTFMVANGPWTFMAKGMWEFEAKHRPEGFMGQLKIVRAF